MMLSRVQAAKKRPAVDSMRILAGPRLHGYNPNGAWHKRSGAFAIAEIAMMKAKRGPQYAVLSFSWRWDYWQPVKAMVGTATVVPDTGGTAVG